MPLLPSYVSNRSLLECLNAGGVKFNKEQVGERDFGSTRSHLHLCPAVPPFGSGYPRPAFRRRFPENARNRGKHYCWHSLGKIIVFRFSTPNFTTGKRARRKEGGSLSSSSSHPTLSSWIHSIDKPRPDNGLPPLSLVEKKQVGKKGRGTMGGREEDTKPLPPKKPRRQTLHEQDRFVPSAKFSWRTRVTPLRLLKLK